MLVYLVFNKTKQQKMNICYCQHILKENCNCQVIEKAHTIIIPRRYLSTHFPRKKKNSQTAINMISSPVIECKCSSRDACSCLLLPQTAYINTHQYQSIINIPKKYRTGLQRIITFVLYSNDNNNTTEVIPTIPSEFSLSYLETKNWNLQLKALSVPKNKNKSGVLYVMIDGQTTGWFELPLKIKAKLSSKNKSPQSKKRTFNDCFQTNEPCQMLSLSCFISTLKLFSQLHPLVTLPLTPPTPPKKQRTTRDPGDYNFSINEKFCPNLVESKINMYYN